MNEFERAEELNRQGNAHREAGDPLRREKIAFEQTRRQRQHIGDIVEPIA